MKGRLSNLLLTALCFALATGAGVTFADGLKVYTVPESDPGTPEDTMPDPSNPSDPWSTPANNTVTLQPNQTIYIAFLNEEIVGNVKTFKIKLQGDATNPVGSVSVTGSAYNGATASPATAAPGGLVWSIGEAYRQVKSYRWRGPSQPWWERVKLKNNVATAKTFRVTATNLCASSGTLGNYLSVENASFGATTLGAMSGPMRVTEFMLIPRANSVDQTIAPTIFTPPGSGVWQSRFVTLDPEGNSLPQGGVEFFTADPGLGIQIGDVFSLSFAMNGAADTDYWLYIRDDEEPEYEDRVRFVLGDLPAVPAISNRGRVILAVVLLAAIALLGLLRRKSAASAV